MRACASSFEREKPICLPKLIVEKKDTGRKPIHFQEWRLADTFVGEDERHHAIGKALLE